MNYTFHQLQIFLKVRETLSVTRAAEELFLTQPAVSIQLKKFQEQFDIPLVEVVGKRVNITEFGEEIAKIARQIQDGMEEIQYKTKSYKGLITGKLSISSASTGKYVIPYFLNSFLDDHKGIDLVLDVTNKKKVVQSLANLECEFALVSVLPDEISVQEEVLMENKLFLVGNEPRRNKQKPWIFRENGSATRMAMEKYLNDTDIINRKRLELTSNEAVKQAVLAGLGYSIMPIIGIQNELNLQKLFILPGKGLPMTTHWRVIWLNDRKLSPIGYEFVNYLKNKKESIRKIYFEALSNV